MADAEASQGACIFSFYPSDVVVLKQDYNLDSMFRENRFPVEENDNWVDCELELKQYISGKEKIVDKHSEAIQFEEDSGIYYIHLGSSDVDAKYPGLYFTTPRWIWPANYTMFMWVKWTNLYTLTTFDSGGCVPVVVSNKKLAVDRQHTWKYLSKYTINLEQWTFIAVVAGGLHSSFYIGSLKETPKLEETLNIDISDQITYTIGNSGQGPGKVAMLKVYNYKLDAEQIEDEYYDSQFAISLQWNDEELQVVQQTLLKYVQVDAIVACIITFSCYRR